MKLSQEELRSLYTSLTKLYSNLNLDDTPIFKQGDKLIPRCKNGSGIHIKKENRGKFTASAKRAGQSVQEYARSVLNNPNATPLQKKRANFARNAKAWKHQEGGKTNRVLSGRVGNGGVRYDLQDIKRRLGMKHKFSGGNYSGGDFGGGGAGHVITYEPDYTWQTKRDTIYLPIQRNFNEAFAEAVKANVPEFVFNGKKYKTVIGNDPNSVKAGEQRIEQLGVLPVWYDKHKKYRIEQDGKKTHVDTEIELFPE